MPKAYSAQDHYFALAKKHGYRARSAFKLEEILKVFPRLLRKGMKVIDLGAAPGSFLQVLAKRVRKDGHIVGIDLQEIHPFSNSPNLHLVQGDIFSPMVEDRIGQLLGGRADLITSDLAPKTSGIKDVDQWKSVELNQQVLFLCEQFLNPGGDLIAKIFVGADFQEFWKDEFQSRFQKSRTYKPKACRDRSFETYLIGQGYRGSE